MAKTVLWSAVLMALIYFVESLPEKLAQLEPFTFDDIFDPQYRVQRPDARWIAGEDAYTYRRPESGELWKVYADTNKTEVLLIDNSTFVSLETNTYFVSPDAQYVLFACDVSPLWRHSFTAKYKIKLSNSTQDSYDFPMGALSGSVLQYAGWSRTGHSLTFVHGNNLYYQSHPTGTPPVSITTNGDAVTIFNGIPDWLYEEDVLGERVSHYWSPSDDYICYAEINDTGVPLQEWPLYGSVDDVYGKTIQIAYPKAGDVRNGQPGPNTKVKLFIVNVTDPTNHVELSPPPVLQNVDHYYLQVFWLNSFRVYVTWANRVQNHSIGVIYNVQDFSNISSVENLKYSVAGGWVQVVPPRPWIIENGERFLTIHPKPGGKGGPWRHLAVMTSASNATGVGTMEFLTEGEHEVQSIVGYDAANMSVYFISTIGDSTERHLLVTSLIQPFPPSCLTCFQRLPAHLRDFRYFSATFSATGTYHILNCLGPDVPMYSLLMSRSMGEVKLLEDNHKLKTALSFKAMPTRQFMNVTLPSNYTTKAEIFLPPGYVAGRKYPLLVYAYAGPASQRVMKSYSDVGGSTTNWLTYLKSSHEIVVASLDGRGTMAQGDEFMFKMYKNLGTVEVQDQIYGGTFFSQLPYVDDSKPLAMFGWSYGGGTASHVIGDTSKIFTCGIAVAPVTTKKFYDTAYTERYLGLATPDDGELGYNNTEVMPKAANFEGKKYLIAHGIADDNVHFMHSTHLISALANVGIQFRQYVYADQNHGISTPGQSRHLYKSLTHFLLDDCWPALPPAPTTATPPCVGLAVRGASMSNMMLLFSMLVAFFKLSI